MKRKLLLCLIIIGLSTTIAKSQVFSEGFESGSIPTGWTEEGGTVWNITTISTAASASAGGTAAAHTGTYFADCWNSSGTIKLVSPAIDLSSVSNPSLSFYYVTSKLFTGGNTLKVYYKTFLVSLTVVYHQYKCISLYYYNMFYLI